MSSKGKKIFFTKFFKNFLFAISSTVFRRHFATVSVVISTATLRCHFDRSGFLSYVISTVAKRSGEIS